MEEEWEITAAELKRLIDSGTRFSLIDVREPSEHDLCHIPGSKLMPLNRIRNHVNELRPDDEYVFYCHVAERSGWAVNFLRQLGFRKVKSLKGGIDEWAVEIDRSMPRY